MKLLEPKRCNPWLLVITSLFGPGMGQIVTGRIQFGMVLIIFGYAVPALFLHGEYVWSLPGLILFTVLQVGLYLFSICEAIIYGLRHEECQRPSLKQLIPIILFVRLTARVIIWTSPFATYVVPSKSMVPTLKVGDRFSSNRHYYREHTPKRGDIATIRVPGWKNKLIKRIIGLPDDTVELRQDSLFVNGIIQHEPYAIYDPGGTFRNFPAYVVPEKTVFVLGDNRNNSNDSRAYGPVPINLLTGKPVVLFYSRHRGRIGKRIE